MTDRRSPQSFAFRPERILPTIDAPYSELWLLEVFEILDGERQLAVWLGRCRSEPAHFRWYCSCGVQAEEPSDLVAQQVAASDRQREQDRQHEQAAAARDSEPAIVTPAVPGPRYHLNLSAAEIVDLIDVLDDYLARTPDAMRQNLELSDVRKLRDRIVEVPGVFEERDSSS